MIYYYYTQEDKWEEWAPVGVVVEKQEDPITNKVSPPTEVPPKVDEDDIFRDMQPEIKVTPKVSLYVIIWPTFIPMNVIYYHSD